MTIEENDDEWRTINRLQDKLDRLRELVRSFLQFRMQVYAPQHPMSDLDFDYAMREYHRTIRELAEAVK